MSCYSCGTSFGAFKREHGCKNCGFAFCAKCLPHKIDIPKLNNEKHKVCMKCYNIMTGKVKPKDEPTRYSPPENFKKRVHALQEREAAGNKPTKPGATSHTHAPGGSGVGRGKTHHHGAAMSKADLEIQQRLEKLKEKTPQEIAAGKVTEGEIDDRLARLKGMDPDRYKASNKPTFRPPDRRTQQEQMNDLLDEIGNEVELDSHLPDPAQEIEERLARLRQHPTTGQDNTQGTETSENNLNKPSMRDSQTFVQNISDTTSSGSPTTDTPNITSGQPPGTGTGSSSSDSIKRSLSTGSGCVDEEVSAEEVGRILTEAAEGLEQDARRALQGLQQDKEIMRRLQETKQRRKESSTDVNRDDNLEHSDSENEDGNEEDEDDDNALAEAVIKQALAEARLDEAAAKDGIEVKGNAAQTDPDTAKKSNNNAGGGKNTDGDEWYDPDELPYCCICTEDATVRCIDCDRDLYCSKCFSDGHKELCLTDHKSIKYTPPKGLT